MAKERYYSESLLHGLAYDDDVNGNCDGMIDFTVVDSIDGADVEPVVHGKWIPKTQIYPMFGALVTVGYLCSNCRAHQEHTSNYCATCGADMRGVAKNE